ncbi:GST N-terminal domain-containing protein [Balamuthia mandrillaris]
MEEVDAIIKKRARSDSGLGAIDSIMRRSSSNGLLPPSASSSPEPGGSTTASASSSFSDVNSALPPPTLVLHFDINKTIVIADPVAGRTTEDMLNSIIAEVAWGKVDPETGVWRPVSETLNLEKPAEADVGSYHDYVEQLHPFPEEVEGESAEERAARVRELKRKRHDLTRKFTLEGSPGQAFRKYYDNLFQSLAAEEGKQHYIIPAFFELILHLVMLKQPFLIVFRSFGTDLEKVVEEFNKFCEGQHPFYPDVCLDGSQMGGPDIRLKDEKGFGCFYRGEQGTALVMGTTDTVHPHEKGLAFYEDDKYKDKCDIYEGFTAIHDYLNSKAYSVGLSGATIAIRDYYPWWGNNNESITTGKLLLVQPEDKTVHHIFFDDNIMTGSTASSSNIIDIRNVESSESVGLKEALDLYMVKVQPTKAITNKRYFIDCLHRCEEAFRSSVLEG